MAFGGFIRHFGVIASQTRPWAERRRFFLDRVFPMRQPQNYNQARGWHTRTVPRFITGFPRG